MKIQTNRGFIGCAIWLIGFVIFIFVLCHLGDLWDLLEKGLSKVK